MGEIKQQLADEAAADEAAQLEAVPLPLRRFHAEPAAHCSVRPKTFPLRPQSKRTASNPGAAAAAEPRMEDEVQFVLTPTGKARRFKLTNMVGRRGLPAFSLGKIRGGAVNLMPTVDGSGQSDFLQKGRGVSGG